MQCPQRCKQDGEKGYFEAASRGTLLLDEIDALSISVQAKFLGVLEERSFYRVGGSRKIHIAARIIATTNIRIEDTVTQGYFRKDLFYRLNVLRLNIPPLRDRKEDIAFFIRKFMSYFNRKFENIFKTCLSKPETHCSLIPDRAISANCAM